jgi:hypothetical protein
MIDILCGFNNFLMIFSQDYKSPQDYKSSGTAERRVCMFTNPAEHNK